MNRLTKDINNQYDDTTYSDIVKGSIDRENIILTKLKHYENIEEEIGIDLITLFKILNFQEIVVKNKGCISGYASNCSCGWFELNYNNKCMIYNVVRKEKYQQPKYYYFEDYGKTWALTKGELENDK